MSQAPNAAHPGWIDDTLAPLLIKPPGWPVATAERSQAQQHNRLRILAGVFLVILIAIFNTLIFTLPGGADSTMPLKDHLFLTVAVPVGVIGLVYIFLYFVVVYGRRDGQGHPWKFYADTRGMSLEIADGNRVGGSWRDWRYEGYVYGTIKNNRFVKGIDLSLDGKRYAIDLLRVARSGQLARAIVQGLAAATEKRGPA